MELAGFGLMSVMMTLVVALATLAVPVAIIVLLVMLVRRSGQPPAPPAGWGPDPRAILGDRLARGEITLDEYDTAMRALGFPAGPRPGGGPGVT